MKKILIATLTVLFSLLITCSFAPLAGNGSEITNGVCMMASVPADSALVVAYPHDYQLKNTALPETTYTDANGNFSLKHGAGAWNLLIYDRTKTYGAFVPIDYRDSSVGIVDLDSLGYVEGTVAGGIMEIIVPGSPFHAFPTTGDRAFSITNMPAFTYAFHVVRLILGSCSGGGDCVGLPPPALDTATHTVTVKAGSGTNVIIP